MDLDCLRCRRRRCHLILVMAATYKSKCRVCGKEYEACHSLRADTGMFRWREVACSPECGEEYLHRVLESRGQLPKEEKPKRAKKRAAKSEKVAPLVDGNDNCDQTPDKV